MQTPSAYAESRPIRGGKIRGRDILSRGMRNLQVPSCAMMARLRTCRPPFYDRFQPTAPVTICKL